MFHTLGPPECSITVNASAETDTGINVMWQWTNCLGAEPSRISLEWFPAHNSGNARNISYVPASYEITGLEPDTSYSIMAIFTDACGNITVETIAVTRPAGEC